MASDPITSNERRPSRDSRSTGRNAVNDYWQGLLAVGFWLAFVILGSSMSNITLKINGQAVTVDVPSDMPLLWALRDKLNLVGTKYSCGVGVCGSCMVLVNGIPMRSCVTPAVSMAGMEITTIEGLGPTGEHPVQKAWNDEDVPQCGYCQAGQVLTATALLRQNPDPSDEDIDSAMSGVLCRCGTYPRIRKAIKRAAEYAAETGGES